ncbi:SpoIID/LytB domain-containing protein [Ruminiclostridium herbifermentans]|nr:SpoIID/LytB domain-containing protein [Ruminiclostridium herbifermentans]
MVLKQIFNTAGPTPYVPTNIKVLRKATNTIETVPLETYISRVIPGEIGDKMGGKTVEQIKEIYRTQAIAARGYATYSTYFDRKHGSSYDVCDSTCCQVYNPNLTNSYATTATNDTAKKIPALVSGSPYNWNIKYVHAFFFNSCSGNTKSCKDVWGTDVSYLVSVSCPYDPTKYAIPATDGHGVGLCQDGTAGYVTNGYLYTDILPHYYTGASVVTGTYN